MPTLLGKSKWKVLGSFVIMSSLSFISIMTWLNCCKVFWWFYCVDTKAIVFFLFLIFCFFQLFPVFICANNYKKMVIIMLFFGENIFDTFSSFASYSSLSRCIQLLLLFWLLVLHFWLLVLLFYETQKLLPGFLIFFAMSVCFSKSLPNSEYSNPFVVAAFSYKSFFGKLKFIFTNISWWYSRHFSSLFI